MSDPSAQPPSGAPSHDLTGRVLGSYRVSRVITSGGMGMVYEAAHLRLPDKRVAVKVLLRDILAYPEAYRRFRREAEIASGLGHPHIVDVIDFNETEQGQPYMVMEFLRGEDLAARLDREGRLDPAELLELVTQLASALSAAHARGVVHRDLKPANIFLVTGAGRLHAKLLDFGVSKIRDAQSLSTQEGTLVGTPHYMAPEQATGSVGDVDERTDIFALGTICYEALAGRRPFDAPSLHGITYCICHEAHRPLSEIAPGVPPAIDHVIAKALAKRRSDRYERVEDLKAALAEALGPQPTPAGFRRDRPLPLSETLPPEDRSDTLVEPPQIGEPMDGAAGATATEPETGSSSTRALWRAGRHRRGLRIAAVAAGVVVVGAGIAAVIIDDGASPEPPAAVSSRAVSDVGGPSHQDARPKASAAPRGDSSVGAHPVGVARGDGGAVADPAAGDSRPPATGARTGRSRATTARSSEPPKHRSTRRRGRRGRGRRHGATRRRPASGKKHVPIYDSL